MSTYTERMLTGLEAVNAITQLLRRCRNSHPTKGVLESMDFHWWWRTARRTDALPQLFWIDEHNEVAAAAPLTDWQEAIGLDPLVLPDTGTEWLAHVLQRGRVHAAQLGLGVVECSVDAADTALAHALSGMGWQHLPNADMAMSLAWLDAANRPAVHTLATNYTSTNRAALLDGSTGLGPIPVHHMAKRNGPEMEERLKQTSLYRADLDLVVLDAEGLPAAYALFWIDQSTGVGLVEPMRTENAHQRKGLAKHLLTLGIEKLARLGAERFKLAYSPRNNSAAQLYAQTGFRTSTSTAVWTAPS